MIAVDPDYQNQGVGSELVTFAVDRIVERGMSLAEIGTGGDPGHAPARRVYEKAGFSPINGPCKPKLGPFFSGHAGPIVMLPRSELAVITCGEAAFFRTVTVLDPTKVCVWIW